MRMVETDDLEAASPSGPARIDMVLRIDEKPVGAARQVACPDGLVNLIGLADEHAAAFAWLGFARVRDDRFEDAGTKSLTANREPPAPSP